MTATEPEVHIRYAEPRDAERLADLLARNREYLQDSEPIRDDDYFTAADQRRRLERAVQDRVAGRSAMFLIEADGRLAGRMNLGGIIRGAFQSAGVGYAVDQALTGRGIATSALRAAIRYAFEDLDLHRLHAETQTANAASKRVLDRCGFMHYGRAPEYARINGSWQTIDFYQLINQRHSV